MQKKAIFLGVLSGLLFGIATPISKLLLVSLSSYSMAGLLYLGAALVFLPDMIRNYKTDFSPALIKNNGLKLAGIILFGGMLGPMFLLAGLKNAQSTSVSIWLNFELIATAILGVLFFKEHLSKYAVVGIVFTLASGIVISLAENMSGLQSGILIMLACISWGVDNHLTAIVDGISSKATTFIKGLIGGVANITIGILFFNTADLWQSQSVLAVLLGMVAYGLSIVLYVSTTQIIGATRGQILFSTSPLWGILGAALLLAEPITWTTILSFALLTVGIFFSNVTGHSHDHAHEETEHIHLHSHSDGHHVHEHFGVDKDALHVHIHSHQDLVHAHDHLPDVHHRHVH
jgi:drug/metabolite transporter (DMT)-like permease